MMCVVKGQELIPIFHGLKWNCQAEIIVLRGYSVYWSLIKVESTTDWQTRGDAILLDSNYFPPPRSSHMSLPLLICHLHHHLYPAKSNYSYRTYLLSIISSIIYMNYNYLLGLISRSWRWVKTEASSFKAMIPPPPRSTLSWGTEDHQGRLCVASQAAAFTSLTNLVQT